MIDQEWDQFFREMVVHCLRAHEQMMETIHLEARAAIDLLEEKGIITEEELNRKASAVEAYEDFVALAHPELGPIVQRREEWWQKVKQLLEGDSDAPNDECP